ncbi:glycosyltransferase [Nakamurella deserti]|uniref:glycosyltransferase n=1 Tax=Nakamurella deserti TaxID=2164074 RepID=UPI000DBE4433|nr:glycosyltransferase [Nakamurella deserti]
MTSGADPAPSPEPPGGDGQAPRRAFPGSVGGPPPLGPPRVAVWRDEWLATSETFIANQIGATHRWKPVPAGLRVIPDGLPLRPARVLGDRISARIAHQIDAELALRLFYDSVLRREPVQVVHAHFGPDAVTVLPLARRLGLPLVVTFHGFDVTSAPAETGGAGRRYVDRLREVFDYADTLIAVSRFIAGRLRDLGAPSHKIVVAPIGIPVQPGTHDDQARCGVSFVGRLVPKKGVSDLIDGLAGVPRELLDGQPIRVIGYGPDETALRDRARRAGLPVEFLGKRDPAFIADTLARSRIFCGPSRTAANGDSEGFGMVYLEAALQAVPVVAYRHGGVPEAVADGETGLLVPEGDVAALTACLTRLLVDADAAAAMGAAGRRRVLEEFDIERRTLRLEEIYDRAVGR